MRFQLYQYSILVFSFEKLVVLDKQEASECVGYRQEACILCISVCCVRNSGKKVQF